MRPGEDWSAESVYGGTLDELRRLAHEILYGAGEVSLRQLRQWRVRLETLSRAALVKSGAVTVARSTTFVYAASALRSVFPEPPLLSATLMREATGSVASLSPDSRKAELLALLYAETQDEHWRTESEDLLATLPPDSHTASARSLLDVLCDAPAAWT